MNTIYKGERFYVTGCKGGIEQTIRTDHVFLLTLEWQ